MNFSMNISLKSKTTKYKSRNNYNFRTKYKPKTNYKPRTSKYNFKISKWIIEY